MVAEFYLVLGGSKGLGKKVGEFLATQQKRVLLVGREFSDYNFSENIEYLNGDLTNSTFVDNLALRFNSHATRLRQIYFCFACQSEAEPELLIKTNVYAPLMVTQRLQEIFTRDTTRVIFIGSDAAFFPIPAMAIYSASKAFLRQWALAWSGTVSFSVGIYHPPAMSLPDEFTYVTRRRLKLKNPALVAQHLVNFANSQKLEGYYRISSRFNRLLLALLPLPLLIRQVNRLFVRIP